MRLRLFILLFGWFSIAFSQDREGLVEEYYTYYRNFAESKTDSALNKLLVAERINSPRKDKDWDAKIYYGIGHCYFLLQKYDVALRNLDLAVENAEDIDNLSILSRSYNQIGLIYSFQNKTKVALEYFNKSLKISENNDELNDNTVAVFTNIAELYIQQRDTINARRYYQQAKILGERENKRINLAVVYNNIAVSYMTSNKDSTEFYLSQAINIYRDTGNKYGQIMAQINLATTYLNFNSTKDFPKALALLNESLRLSLASKDIEAEYLSNFYLGNFYEKTERNYKMALSYYNRAYQLIKEGFKHDATIELYKRLSHIYFELGDFQQAYEFQSIQHNLKDSIFSVQKDQQFMETLTKFDVERKNIQIQLLNKEKEIQRAAKINVIIISLLLIIPLLILAAFYRTRLNYQKTIREQDQLLFEKEKESIKAMNLIEGQKQERSRIAKELHDGVGGKLSAIKIKMDQLNTTSIHDDELKECISQLQDTAKEIRVISHELNDDKMNELDFVDLLRHLVKDYQLFFVGEIHLNIFPVEKIKEIQDFRKHFLYRTIQEIFSNAIKYADAQNIYLDCTFDEKFRFIIEDDGKGFEMKSVKMGMGLSNIEKRVKAMKGEFFIDSKIGRGSTFIIEIPENGD